MDNEGGIVHRKRGSKPPGKQCPPIGTKPETHNDRRVARGSENISYGRREPKAFARHPYDPMEYNDIFGGPPRHISATHAERPSVVVPKVYDEVFKGFRTELHLSSKGSAALPVFELPAYEKSSLPVFELPVLGGSSLPVFDLSSRGEDSGSGGTWTKSSSDDFYDDIFGGSGGVSGSNKDSVSKTSRSRSKSSSSQLSSENLSPHHLPFSRMTEDQSSSSFASKLRPIAIFPKQDCSSIFGIPCRQQRGYPCPDSDEVSVVSSACSSPSRMNSSDPFSLHSSGCNKPLAFNKGKGGLKLDDVFEVCPQQGHSIHLQSTVKPEDEYINRFKAGTTLGIVDQADIPEHYSALLNAPRNNLANYGYDLGEQINASAVSHEMDMGNAFLAEKAMKGLEEMLLPIDRAHLMIPNMVASTPLQSPPALHRVKSCKDWVSEVKKSQFNQKRGSSSISLAGSSCISPTTDSGSGVQEQQEEFKLEDLRRNSLDDGEGSDFLGSYVIEIVSHRNKNFISPDENHCHLEDSSMPDASAVAMKEAIAWAKEKFQLGSWKEGREEVPTFVQGPKHKDAQVWVHETTQTDAGTERIIQVGNDAGTNGEGRLQEMSAKSLSHRTFERSENLAGGLTDQSEDRLESHDELLKCNKVSDQPNREIELRMPPLPVQCATIDAQERVIKEVLDDVIISCKQHPMNHDDMGTFSTTPELQNMYAMDATSDIPTMVGLSNLWEESDCYELQGHDVDGHVVCGNSHQSKGNDVKSTMVKEIPKMRTKLKLEQQQRENEHMMTLEILNRGIKCWSVGKEGNIRSLLATLQHVLWPETGWQQIPLIDMIEEEAVKKTYEKARLCIHPDKVQQKGATMQQKYVAEKVLSILQRAWIAFNSEDNF